MTDTERGTRAITRMPAVFGSSPGPRQRPDGTPHDLAASPDAVAAWVQASADRGAVARLLPDGFEPAEVSDLMVEVRNLTNVGWLAGRGYSLVQVSTAAVWTGGAAPIEGRFALVLFENRADAILTGREDLGYAKVFAEIPDVALDGERASAGAAWDGTRFLDLSLSGLREAPLAPDPQPGGPSFHWKYFPRTEHWGDSDVSYYTMTPASGSKRRLTDVRTGEGDFGFQSVSWDQLPTLSHIVNPLSRLETGPKIAAGYYRSVGGKDLGDQTILRSGAP